MSSHLFRLLCLLVLFVSSSVALKCWNGHKGIKNGEVENEGPTEMECEDENGGCAFAKVNGAGFEGVILTCGNHFNEQKKKGCEQHHYGIICYCMDDLCMSPDLLG